MATTGHPAARAEAVSPPATEKASGKLLAPKTATGPIQLLIKDGKHYRTVTLDYHGGLRYPRLERDPSVPARLDDILAPRK